MIKSDTKPCLNLTNSFLGQTVLTEGVVELSDYDNLVRNDLLDFLNYYYTPQNTYIIISGKIDKKTISLLNKYFGNNSKGDTVIPDSNLNIVNKVEGLNKFVKKEGTLQSAIRIGKPIINKQHPDYNSLIVLNTVLGGYFGSRLMSNLRENKGYTYGISSYMINYKHAGFFSIATEVNAQHSNAALEEIKNELTKLCNENISSQELNLVKLHLRNIFKKF